MGVFFLLFQSLFGFRRRFLPAEPSCLVRSSIGLGFFEFEWKEERLKALHQTMGEPVGVGNSVELYTTLAP